MSYTREQKDMMIETMKVVVRAARDLGSDSAEIAEDVLAEMKGDRFDEDTMRVFRDNFVDED